MFLDYLMSHIKIIFFGIITFIIFAVIFSLYSLPVSAVLYSAAISGFAGIILLTADYFSYRGKRIILKKLSREITLTTENLPVPERGIETDYDALLREIFSELKNTENKMNEKISDMTDYYTIWAHQIKTPIAAIGLIFQQIDVPEKSELTEQLRRIEQYVDMVMCYLRLSSDSTDYIIKEYEIDEIIRQSLRKFSSEFIRKKINLNYEPLRKIVITDEKWLFFVIEQVLSNALKYTASGEIKIYSEDPLTLCISDTGIGISADDIPRIFEKGYTGCNGRIDKKASGLGLYLCRKICGKLGHEINAESSENGTTIKIDLNIRKIEIE